MSSADPDPQHALREGLNEQYPDNDYLLEAYPIDLPGWAFFEIGSSNPRNDHVMYRAVREDGSIIDADDGESELAAMFESIGLLDGGDPPPSDDLATIVLCAMAVNRQNLVKNAGIANSTNENTRGARLAAPTLDEGRSSAVLTFWTKWSARAVLVWSYKVKVKRGYRVKVSAKQRKIRYK